MSVLKQELDKSVEAQLWQFCFIRAVRHLVDVLDHKRDVLANAKRINETSLLWHQIKFLDHLEQVCAADDLALLLLRLKCSKAFRDSVVFGLVSIISRKYLLVKLQVSPDKMSIAKNIGC